LNPDELWEIGFGTGVKLKNHSDGVGNAQSMKPSITDLSVEIVEFKMMV
jgi:hypothetical protein